MKRETIELQAQPITSGPLHHWFGYYDKCPWDQQGTRVLAMENQFADRNPAADESLTIGYVDLEDECQYRPVAQTLAWNWQQGCMLRWKPPHNKNTIMFNDRQDGNYVSVEMDIETGMKSYLPWPVYDISDDGTKAGSLNFERITSTRPGYGYFGLPDPFADQLHPDNDGVYVIDMQKQTRELIFTLKQACQFGRMKPGPNARSWFNHIKFNPGGNGMLFLHRWAEHAVPGHHGFTTRMFFIEANGNSPVCLLEGVGISHFDWLDDENILVWLWSEAPDPTLNHYFIVNARTGQRQIIGKGLFDVDGHCVYSPDRRWVITDTYPKGPKQEQTLILYNSAENRRIDIGKYPALPTEDPSWRCDLHTRWDRTGKLLSFDSTHEGTRQMYVVNVEPLVG